MQIYKAKKLIIVTEASISEEVIKMMTAYGVDGYTVLSASGKGRRGLRHGISLCGQLLGNVRIEVVASEEVVKNHRAGAKSH